MDVLPGEAEDEDGGKETLRTEMLWKGYIEEDKTSRGRWELTC